MSYLNTPLETGRLKLKNRLVMPPMATAKAEGEGRISREILEYYNEKSMGGYFSLIIIEHSYISRQGKASERQISAAEDDLAEDLKKLSDTIHLNGCKTVMQLNHAGSAALRQVTGMEPVGPSAIRNPSRADSGIPAELDGQGIRGIVNEFKAAAVRVKKAGFDGVEIHSAHGYLLNQFLSPLTNKRTDEYGGSVEGRSRLHVEIIRAVREAVGEEFPILLRLGAADYMEGGLTIEESKIAARAFEMAGVDLLDISGGMCRYLNPSDSGPGYFSSLSKDIKDAVSIPVLVTGGITKAEEAEAILRDNMAELVGVGRAVAKDSEWAKKAFQSLAGK